MRNGRTKNVFLLVILILAGIVVGGLIGELLVNLANAVPALSFLKYLGYYHSFGLESPILLDLSVLKLQFGFTVQFSIFGVIGMIIALFIYRKL